MESLLDALKFLKVWQISVLAAVLLGAAGATYGVYAVVSGNDATGLTEGQQLIPVQIGHLVNQVSTNGSLIYPERELLTFGTQGTVEEVLVEEGDRVIEGQIIAKLDQATVASLEKTIAQARISLQAAEDALAKARDPHTALDTAQAEAKVANAEIALIDAKDALDRLRSVRSQDLAQAEAAVANARLTLSGNQDAVARLLSPTSQEMAQAEAAVANAKLALEDSEEALEGLLSPTSQSIAQGQAAVANAKLAVKDAQDALERLLTATSEEVAKAEAAVTNAKLSVEGAREALDAVKNGASEEDIAKSRSQVESAGVALSNALGDLSLAQKDWDAKLETSRGAFDTALEAYQIVFQKWLGVFPGAVTGDMDPDALLNSWGVALESLFDPDLRFQDVDQRFQTQGPPADDPATPWSEWVVYAWMNLNPVPLVATCEDTILTPETLCVKKEIDDSWDALVLATDNLDTAETQAAKALANSEVAVNRAEESLVAAEESLADIQAVADPLEVESKENQLALAMAALEQAEDDLSTLKNSPDELEEESLRNKVAVAQANVETAQDDLAELKSGPDEVVADAKRMQVAVAMANFEKTEEELQELKDGPDALDVDAKRKLVAVAQANLEKAEEDLTELMTVPDALEVEAKTKQVAVAQASLGEAQEELAELRGSVDVLEVALREADVASAQLALDTALQRLEDSTIESPINGDVSLVNVEAGQEVNPRTNIVELVDTTTVEVDGAVDEIDVLFVRVGARAEVTMDSLPGEVLEGTVSSISSAARNQQGVVSYPIRIQLALPEGVELREGLSAVASIVLREERDVLLVPLQAIHGTFERPVVRVMTDGGIEERELVLGNSDDFWVVVLQGLQEGEQIAMETREASDDPFAQIRQQIQAGRGRGGGFGGGGGFPGGGGRRQGN